MPNQPYRSADIPKVQELLDQGKTHAAIEGEIGVSRRAISRWLKDGWLHRPAPVPARVAPLDAPERATQQEWTARALLDLGMDPAIVARTLTLVEYEPATSTRRYREWLSRYIPLVAAKIPDEWAAAVAFLPILGRDLCNPALEELAALMHESVPWKDKQLRKRYGRLAIPLKRKAQVGLNDWLLFLSCPQLVATNPVVEAGVVSEVVLRCFYVDQPVRKRRSVHKEDRALGLHPLREMPMGALAMSWSRILDGDPPWLEAYANYTRGKARRQEKGKNIQ